MNESELAKDDSIMGQIQDVPAGTIKNALVKIDITDAHLAKIKAGAVEVIAKYDGSKKAMEEVKAYRLSVRPVRTGVKKVAEEGRAEAREVQALWIEAERKVTTPLQDVEAMCQKVEDEFEAKLQAERDRLAAIEKAKLDARLEKLRAFEWDGNEFQVAQASDEQFAEIVAKAKTKFDELVELRRVAAEARARQEREAAELAETNRKESERLAEAKRKQEAGAETLRKEREAFEAEKTRVAREQQDAANKAERDRLAAENAEKDRKLAEAETERKRIEAENHRLAQEKADNDADELKAKQEEAEKARLAALAPDKEKLLWFAGELRDLIGDRPQRKLDTEEGKMKWAEGVKNIERAIAIFASVEGLS